MWKIKQIGIPEIKGLFLSGCARFDLKVMVINKNQPLLFKCATALHEALHILTSRKFDKIIDVLDITTQLQIRKMNKEATQK